MMIRGHVSFRDDKDDMEVILLGKSPKTSRDISRE